MARRRPTRRYHRARSGIRFSSRTDFREPTTTSGSTTRIKRTATGWRGACRLRQVNIGDHLSDLDATRSLITCCFINSARSAFESLGVGAKRKNRAHHMEPAIAGELLVVQAENPRLIRLPIRQQNDCDWWRLAFVSDERLNARRNISNPSVHDIRRQGVGSVH